VSKDNRAFAEVLQLRDFLSGPSSRWRGRPLDCWGNGTDVKRLLEEVARSVLPGAGRGRSRVLVLSDEHCARARGTAASRPVGNDKLVPITAQSHVSVEGDAHRHRRAR
jgi:hypothetical protein